MLFIVPLLHHFKLARNMWKLKIEHNPLPPNQPKKKKHSKSSSDNADMLCVHLFDILHWGINFNLFSPSEENLSSISVVYDFQLCLLKREIFQQCSERKWAEKCSIHLDVRCCCKLWNINISFDVSKQRIRILQLAISLMSTTMMAWSLSCCVSVRYWKIFICCKIHLYPHNFFHFVGCRQAKSVENAWNMGKYSA